MRREERGGKSGDLKNRGTTESTKRRWEGKVCVCRGRAGVYMSVCVRETE